MKNNLPGLAEVIVPYFPIICCTNFLIKYIDDFLFINGACYTHMIDFRTHSTATNFMSCFKYSYYRLGYSRQLDGLNFRSFPSQFDKMLKI